MMCLPDDTEDSDGFSTWIAYAYVNHWLSVYRGPWCSYPSGQMHEIGHNLNLAHSGESSTYDDQSGMVSTKGRLLFLPFAFDPSFSHQLIDHCCEFQINRWVSHTMKMKVL